MAHDETTYEQSLETMNEEALRAECVRLKEELDKVQVQVLTEPAESGRYDIYRSISNMKGIVEKLRENHTMYTTDTDMATVLEVVDGLVSIVGQIDAKTRELSEAIDTDLQPTPPRGGLFRDE